MSEIPSTFGMFRSTTTTSQSCISSQECGLESFGQRRAGMSLLFQVGSQESSDGGLVVNDEEFERFAV